MSNEVSFEIVSPYPETEPFDSTSMTREQAAILLQIENIARFMDSAVKVPGVNFRFGADSVIGLILPGIGDFIGAMASGYIVLQANKLGLPSAKIARMVSNVFVDAGVGVVPFAGDIFDLAVKANLKNANLIREHFGLPPLLRK